MPSSLGLEGRGCLFLNTFTESILPTADLYDITMLGVQQTVLGNNSSNLLMLYFQYVRLQYDQLVQG
jgi:hypothetical protein